MSNSEGDYLHIVMPDEISASRQRFGRMIIWGSATLMGVVLLLQTLDHRAI
ncbi:MAG TPA: sugar ABC transporter permease, partial [Rhodobacteraceae bacterium]|nr:sugar ABC transporter permease [Paracoccaceae bacterium]